MGTTAELWLPIATSEPTGTNAPEQQEPIAVILDRALTVLAVDDDGLVLMNTVLMLEDLGHEATQAQSGKEALEILRSGFLPDIVISDHAMPGMTGSELAMTIAAEYPNIPVVLATGYAELPSGKDTGVRLLKPFTQSQLTDALARASRKGGYPHR
jgi:CheY-like chemotaxis protein